MDKEMLPERAIGDTYEPNMLPDHRSNYFNHDKAKLVQRDYKDTDGSLIALHELYGKLTEGTLILVVVSLVTYVIKEEGRKNKKIYHALVEKLKILDHGEAKPWNPPIPVMPERRPFYTPSPKKRVRNEVADVAFDNFGSSPSKKQRK
ncbi:hypothetical protein B0H10DRAFT_2441218 [Mycena sp. CBHHK59/15]|nr:hypothetical protein B0H10DRAFT_2205362 [Mycena sp. CBHHK59/15]KAJ6541951.1 hypothetical protein B0H10DRAFT_2203481 [Mycena sp. CBHHK59/15]KAJ6547881.1 hypothetical protein B0H10DRAFT_2243334 [Mycena sp. CBHHK59/15]KAJ6556702.1 hypothetical protein B0H10DRAFT_2241148 [Mycena sp. CBHHK59/15]KAJ6599597.1 hypothetical protein B0H10DRAFT_2441218 [Mycena sp. CBHHK59/15]